MKFQVPFLRRGRRPDVAALHDAIMAAARRPAFFVAGGVADSLEGRFEVYALHAGLALRRCVAGGAAMEEAGRALADAVFDRFDVALRELGVSDARIAKKMKALGGDLYGRGQAYGAALDADDPGALEAALARNVFGRGAAPTARSLAAYARALAAAFGSAPDEDFVAGRVAFPDPAAFLDGAPR